jgi:hypothetical protein
MILDFSVLMATIVFAAFITYVVNEVGNVLYVSLQDFLAKIL